MTKPSVFITGASGLVGRSLSIELVKQGHKVCGFALGEQFFRNKGAIKPLIDSGNYTFVQGTILDKLALVEAMSEYEVVVHLAAMKGARTFTEPLKCLDININGTSNVLEACVAANVKRVIFASSSAVYGEPNHNPISEQDEMKPINTYGISKLAAEEILKGYADFFPQLSYTIARMFNVYGELNNSRFVLDLFASQVLNGKNPTVYGDGMQKRCFTHADDVAIGIARILNSDLTKNKIYNLGFPSEALSIKELAQRAIDVLAPESNLSLKFVKKTDAGPVKEIEESFADITQANKDFGFSPSIGIDEGLRRLNKTNVLKNELLASSEESKPES